MATTQIARCPYPDCGREEEHDGDHGPEFRLVQRYHYVAGKGMHPGFCKRKEACTQPAVALYVPRDGGPSLEVCAFCELEMIDNGQAADDVVREPQKADEPQITGSIVCRRGGAR